MTRPIWHPFTQHGLKDAPIGIARAEGARLYTEDGRAIVAGGAMVMLLRRPSKRVEASAKQIKH